MPRSPDERGAPLDKAPLDIKATGKALDASTVTAGNDAAGELVAWGAAVHHLHAAGLPAAVPPFPAAWLRRRGIAADWVTAA